MLQVRVGDDEDGANGKDGPQVGFDQQSDAGILHTSLEEALRLMVCQCDDVVKLPSIIRGFHFVRCRLLIASYELVRG